jgi:REP element-mobilizing transposase RayT
MPYCQLYYHLVWTTKERQPLLVPEVTEVVYGFIRSKTVGLEGKLFALNGVEDHVHLVVSIPAKIAVSTFVGQVKGVSSARINQERPNKKLYWQAEYGAFSFDKKRLPNVVHYVQRQQEHHAANNLIPILERSTEEESRPIVREPSVTYAIDDAVWWQQMLEL